MPSTANTSTDGFLGTPELALGFATPAIPARPSNLADELAQFRDFGQPTRILATEFEAPQGKRSQVRTFVNEFWTARQRQAASLHEVAYRACFKPQLPRFFIERLTEPGDVVFDPFAGRGTTIVEAALLGRKVIGNDINPLSRMLTLPRLRVPNLSDVERHLDAIPAAKNQ